ncbi:MAG: hypothetical protein J1E98_02545 [Lachnospiraceae bacterium]|nr:hypothetical protein [Lachnospiraceae bacterium]
MAGQLNTQQRTAKSVRHIIKIRLKKSWFDTSATSKEGSCMAALAITRQQKGDLNDEKESQKI